MNKSKSNGPPTETPFGTASHQVAERVGSKVVILRDPKF